MDTFEDLGLSPELVEALAAEGIERPTTLQLEAIPVLRRGNAAMVRAGAGAGVLVAYGAAILDRIAPGGGGPHAIVLVPGTEQAVRNARALGRAGAATGHRIAALPGPFALPGHADILFTTPDALLAATSAARVKLEEVRSWILDGGAALLGSEGSALTVERILEVLPHDEVQGVVVTEPVTDEVREFVERHLPRAIHLPSDAAAPDADEGAPIHRGSLRVRAIEGDPGLELAAIVADLLDEGEFQHALLFFRGEDQAADGGDLLGLHGYLAGAPGEADFPVWLAVDALAARKAIRSGTDAGVAAVSVGAPTDLDELDRRHGGERRGGVILAPGRQLPHIRRIAAEAGYDVEYLSTPSDEARKASRRLHARVAEAVDGADLAPYHLLLEPAVREFGAAQVGAALAWMLRNPGPQGGVGGTADPAATAVPPAAPGAPSAFVRLFLSVGSKDGVGAGDLLGAITGETGVKGDQVGRIDVRDTFSRVEVEQGAAARVIAGLNGITIRGRSVRADYDRAGGRGGGEGGAPQRGGDGKTRRSAGRRPPRNS